MIFAIRKESLLREFYNYGSEFNQYSRFVQPRHDAQLCGKTGSAAQTQHRGSTREDAKCPVSQDLTHVRDRATFLTFLGRVLVTTQSPITTQAAKPLKYAEISYSTIRTRILNM